MSDEYVHLFLKKEKLLAEYFISRTYSIINVFIFRAGNIAQLVECLPTVHEVLCLIHAIAKTRCSGVCL